MTILTRARVTSFLPDVAVQKPASNGCMAELELWREKHSELSSLVEQFKLPTGQFVKRCC